jgi:hypothetical protein
METEALEEPHMIVSNEVWEDISEGIDVKPHRKTKPSNK